MGEEEVEQMIGNGHDHDHMKDDTDEGSSPPLNPQIPSAHVDVEKIKANPLDSLRERYDKRNIPKSLQPDALSNAFQSEKQKAIQNEVNADESLLNGIRQSVQMITSSN